MKKIASLLFASAVVALSAQAARAADVIDPPVYVEPAAPTVIEQATGGWYIRGDIDYHMADMGGVTYAAGGGTNVFDSAELDEAWSLGGGIGYNVSKHFRVDATADYWFKSDFRGSTSGTCGAGPACVSEDISGMSAWVLLANAYADLGTYGGFTPYVGAGIGVAHVKWDDLSNTACDPVTGTCDPTVVHEGGKGWRAAGALMVGASYCLSGNAELDGGYRYTRVGGGTMFGNVPPTGPGFDDGFGVHEVRAGLRYNFGGGSHRCSAPAPQVVEYQPEPAVYK